MTTQLKEERARKLEILIDKYQRVYESPEPQERAKELGVEPISDYEYDVLFRELKDIYEEHPELKPNGSVLDRVSVLEENGLEDVIHDIPMLSLDKAMNREELKAWFKKMIAAGVKRFGGDQKMDGLAIELKYEFGALTQAATRGRGAVGENVTATAYKLKSIPKMIDSKEPDVRVRGEMYMTEASLAKANIARTQKLKKEPYKNVRNGVSGFTRQKDVTHVRGDEAFFNGYGLIGIPNHVNFSDDIHWMRKEGFGTVETSVFLYEDNFDSFWKKIEEFIDAWEARRSTLGYEIDGLVFRADNLAQQGDLGDDGIYPNYAIAFKFTAVEKQTPMSRVEWSYGDKGNIIPNARIEPVDLVGVTVSNCTLHNLDELKRLDLQEGDLVTIKRSGDVIPKITRAVRTANSKPIVIPTTCPVCGAPTVVEGAHLRCSDQDGCPGLFFGKVKSIIDTLEIDDFGPGTLQKAIEAGHIKDQADIFLLTIDQLADLDRLGKKTATKIVNNIAKAKEAPLGLIIAALSIRNSSKSTGELLADKYGSLTNLLNCTKAELMSLEGIGEIMSDVIYKWCQRPENVALVNKLVSLGIGLNQNKPKASSDKLAGKSFCFTGTLSQKRPVLEKMVKDNGGKVSSVSKNLSYIVVGADAGDKERKAKDLGIKKLTEQEFMDLLK